MKLKIKLYAEGNLVIYRVLEQEGIPPVDSQNVYIKHRPTIYDDRITLRGDDKCCDWRVDIHRASTEEDARDVIRTHVKNITAHMQALAENAGEPKPGDRVKVRDSESFLWETRKLITVLPEKFEDRFVCEGHTRSTVAILWKYMSPIAREIRFTHDEAANTYTWEVKNG